MQFTTDHRVPVADGAWLGHRAQCRPPAVAFTCPFGACGAKRTNHPAIREILRQEMSRRCAVAFHQDDQASVPLLDGNDNRLGLRRLEVENWSGPELLGRIRRAAGTAASEA